ncbi:hypothetical protein AvCA_29110 [Azotobacter vinelandii CA]|uniref:Secretion system X translation initiation factor n=2 Tax=Azotobacter vinelandii TaxID=354 RepID=C1DLZ3_AZOVD|nr:hypothetical protein [Azotobacter vinelandii]ACO79080.1 hypothetical protein Avin_29110 [Azotobacter vinelandii DJ]AGK16509.1 hypothetical protein AvCA_29110 [Azotobacter vinelandii CA]AGK20949.1 hypothetical protein AvCA6_29110 [Azotobacter vinelandii CA6]SFX51356.1 hypothetical protein SAMN04244547_01814 [Azotobacter vinelandii]GLK58996.1 hypothetical protein GCM10017624_11530 [Azotobacter vinelandii]
MERRRLLGWLAFLGGAGLLALLPEFFPQEEELLALEARPGGAVAKPETRSGEVRPEAHGVRGGPASGTPVPQADLFAARSWRASRPASGSASPSALVARPPAAPVAPPLPFEFVGRLDDSVRLRVFLLQGDRLHTVEAGEVIDGTYRLERIADDELTLVYLPLNQTQSLSVGDNP